MKFVMEIEAEEESMAEICRAYGVSRKTGYKWLERHQAEGVAGLADRSRAPHSHPNAVSGGRRGGHPQTAVATLQLGRAQIT